MAGAKAGAGAASIQSGQAVRLHGGRMHTSRRVDPIEADAGWMRPGRTILAVCCHALRRIRGRVTGWRQLARVLLLRRQMRDVRRDGGVRGGSRSLLKGAGSTLVEQVRHARASFGTARLAWNLRRDAVV